MRTKGKVSLTIICIMVFIAILAPQITPYDPNNFSYQPLQSPNKDHLLGTNHLGQDNFSALIIGFRVSIGISILSAFISSLVGTFLAVVCAFYRGRIEDVIMKTTELFIILPEIILIMIFASFTRPSVFNVIFVISLFSWSRVTRIVRSKAVVAMTRESIQYALLLKGGFFHIFKKIWLEIYPAVATMFILQCSKAMMYEANLSFLGIGDPTAKSWGRTIRQAMDFEGVFDSYYLWWLVPPIVCIVIFIWSLSIISFDIDKSD
ncbi:ABC transporter permease [Proteinivorax tanatarense]|uniref:ABC transporter permease n=1 Tax=Proteinivorax tanatarense TaxID=1260629 RepID=A0AAU7VPI4_9FIRM